MFTPGVDLWKTVDISAEISKPEMLQDLRQRLLSFRSRITENPTALPPDIVLKFEAFKTHRDALSRFLMCIEGEEREEEALKDAQLRFGATMVDVGMRERDSLVREKFQCVGDAYKSIPRKELHQSLESLRDHIRNLTGPLSTQISELRAKLDTARSQFDEVRSDMSRTLRKYDKWMVPTGPTSKPTSSTNDRSLQNGQRSSAISLNAPAAIQAAIDSVETRYIESRDAYEKLVLEIRNILIMMASKNDTELEQHLMTYMIALRQHHHMAQSLFHGHKIITDINSFDTVSKAR